MGYEAIKVSLEIADLRSLGWGFLIVREQGARVAHNCPIEPGGPREWLTHLLMESWTDQVRALATHTRSFPPM